MTYDTTSGDDYENILETTDCTFPKYKDDGLSWGDVLERDPAYAEWCLENVENMDEELRDALRYGLEHLRGR